MHHLSPAKLFWVGIGFIALGLVIYIGVPHQSQTSLNTYRSDMYGFSFEYPNGWIVSTTTDGLSLDFPQNPKGSISFSVSPVKQGEILNLDCPDEHAYSHGSVVDPVHTADCTHATSDAQVHYTRITQAGQSTPYTYKERFFKTYFFSQAQTGQVYSIEIQMYATDENGQQISQIATEVYAKVLESLAKNTTKKS